jgi:4-amino-4-deoxy-L-arabinose transferase-like glycosyltransferase
MYALTLQAIMKYRIPLLIVFVSFLLFFHSLGTVHLFDWDEINFAESAREMIVSGNYMQVQINFEPFWEKPPVFFWLQVVSMKIFGINEFAARIPNAVCGIFTLLTLFLVGRKLHGQRFGIWWTLLYAASFLPHLYFKSGIIDPWFNFFTFLGIAFLADFFRSAGNGQFPIASLVWSALFTGLAVLTKGPVSLLIFMLTYIGYVILNKGRGWVAFRYYLIWAGVFACVVLAWFGLEVLQHGWWFVEEFIVYQIRLAKTQDAGFAGFPGYTYVVLLVGCFPASVLIFRKKMTENIPAEPMRMFMVAALVATVLVFSLVRTKVIHYSSFAYFPIGYLGAFTLNGLLDGTVRIRKWQQWVLLVLGAGWGLVFTILPLAGTHVEWLKPLLSRDKFAVANLQADVTWGYGWALPGIVFLTAVFVSFRWMCREKYRQAFLLLLPACILMLQTVMTFFVPRIEMYSQNAAIEFFKSVSEEDAYAETVGYKSYAPYYYFSVMPGNRKETKDEQWLLTADVDKPTYLVCRVDKKDRILGEHGSRLEILYEKNGYVFMRRKPCSSEDQR